MAAVLRPVDLRRAAVALRAVERLAAVLRLAVDLRAAGRLAAVLRLAVDLRAVFLVAIIKSRFITRFFFGHHRPQAEPSVPSAVDLFLQTAVNLPVSKIILFSDPDRQANRKHHRIKIYTA